VTGRGQDRLRRPQEPRRGLSIKAKDYEEEQEAVRSLKDQEEASSPGTIGDLIKAQMGK
jgi:hypothetical protein